MHLNHGEAVDVICRKAVCNQCVSIACNQARRERTYTLLRDAIPRYARITYAPAVQLHTKPLAWIKSTSFDRSLSIFGLPDRIRTYDLQSRSLAHYPAVQRVEIILNCMLINLSNCPEGQSPPELAARIELFALMFRHGHSRRSVLLAGNIPSISAIAKTIIIILPFYGSFVNKVGLFCSA